MRSLTKTDKPQILAENEDRWTEDYVRAVGAGEGREFERWRHRQIKEALREELRSRCAYCEGFVDDISFPHVEHIVPKALAPDLAHRWPNMTSACGRCNTAKGEFYDPEDGLIDPYVDQLDEHIHFLGSLVQHRLGSSRGELTIRKLKLNRLALAEQRARRLDSVRAMLDRWHDAQGSLRAALEESIRLDADEGEFSGTVLAYLRAYDFPLDGP